jgi:hypothetical protein
VENELDRTNLALAKLSYRTFKRLLVFQRPPGTGETQIDDTGRPAQGDAAHIDIDAAHPIPANFTMGSRRDLTINEQTRTVTIFKVTIPCIVQTSNGWESVDFSTDYRAHILEKDEFNAERFFQVVGSGDDLGPDITFDAVELQELV